jgi:hypothetical protein
MHENLDWQAGQLYLEDVVQTYARTASVPIDEIQWLPPSADNAACGCVIWSEDQQIYWPIAAHVLAEPRHCVELACQAEMVVQELQRGRARPLSRCR